MGKTPQPETVVASAGTQGPDALDHLRLAAAALRERDGARALAAADEALRLDPESPEGYQLRSRIHRLLGDYVSASHDWASSLVRDPHAAHSDEIRAAALRLREAIGADRVVDEGWDVSRIRSAELRQVLETRSAVLLGRRAAFVRPACSLPCPSYCCYFERESFVYGVCVDPAQLAPLRAFLAQRQLDESAHVCRTPASACTTLDDERLGRFMVEEAGAQFVYFPKTTASRLSGLTPRARPRGSDFRDLAWLNPHGRACVFVSAHGCLIHDLGDPPGLEVCRGFLCLTAFVYLALETFGIVSRETLRGASMEDLNDGAVAALLRLDVGLLTGAEVVTLETGMRESLTAAVGADSRDEPRQARQHLTRYRDLEAEWAPLVAHARDDVRAVALPGSGLGS